MITGERIRRLRKRSGYTQEQLGELLGVKKAAIQKYENGAIVNLKVDTIKRLSEIFDVSPNYIVGWNDDSSCGDCDGVDLRHLFLSLDDVGQKKLLDYARDLSIIYGKM